jgi:hypothetical protein
MATPPYCPSCFTKLEPHMLACPNCPMSFPEDDGPVGSANPLKQSRYYQFLLPALFFAGLGGTVWWLATGLFHLGEESANSPQLKFNSERPMGTPGGPPSSYPPAPKDTPHFEGSGTVSIAPVEDAPPPSGTVSVGVPDEPPAKPKKAIKEWKLRGQVYDLTTLKPLAGCQLTFTDPATNQSIVTRTNSEGRYRAIVPPLTDGGYTVTAAKNGYSPNYLDPATEGVANMSAAQRKELAKGLSATLTAGPSSIQAVSAAPLITDFYLAPRL